MHTIIRRSLFALTLAAVLFVFMAAAAAPALAGPSLFINLTTDEPHRAGMAIFFAKGMMMEKKIPATIFLTVEGVRLGDKRLPENLIVDGKSIRQQLREFIEAGGKVLGCPMCMKNVGNMTADDLVEGAVVADIEMVWETMFADGCKVMSY